jgi:hypothetical protein
MKSVRALLSDKRRSQQGSVLSAVLILVAFLGIIAGAMMTELSTSFLLSQNLVNRVNTEATVNSAIELAFNEFGDTSSNHLYDGCPALSSVTLNGQKAVVSYLSCFPTVYESTKFLALTSATKPFTIEGTHTPVGTFNDYVVGNPDGTVFDYPYGAFSPRWTLGMGGAVTAPTLVMADPNNNRRQFLVIPHACSGTGSGYCLTARSDNGSNGTTFVCRMATSAGAVETRPAASPTSTGIVFFTDGSVLEAADMSAGGGGGGGGGGNGNSCDPESTAGAPLPIVAGPIAFLCSSCGRDQIYAVASDNGSTQLLRFTYHNSTLALAQSVNLPWGSAVGLAASGANLPASLAVTFAGGGIAVVQLAANGQMSSLRSASVSSGIREAPYWCTQCGNLIGVGTQNGLYVLDAALNLYAVPQAGSAPISTAPQADGDGNWYFGADDGYVYEAQVQSGQPVTTRASFGPMSQIGSSVQIGDCHNNSWICVYLGAVNSGAYLIRLDARDAVLTACITSCQASGPNPRLWTHVEVGVLNDPQMVHVQGWSYYSP